MTKQRLTELAGAGINIGLFCSMIFIGCWFASHAGTFYTLIN